MQNSKFKIQNYNVKSKMFRGTRDRNFAFCILHFAFKRREPRGFTLLETIVALTVIVVAMSGPFSLATRGIFSARFAKNKIVAANLAQEGIELVRKLRDDNILAGRVWDFGIGADEESDWQMDVLSESLSPFIPVPLRRDPASGIYNYVFGDETLFTRRITIAKTVDDQMNITARVTWEDAGIARSMTLGETLYNWR